MMQAATPDGSQVIPGQHVLDERVGAKVRIRDSEHFGILQT
jgi:hypothetical protein